MKKFIHVLSHGHLISSCGYNFALCSFNPCLSNEVSVNFLEYDKESVENNFENLCYIPR